MNTVVKNTFIDVDEGEEKQASVSRRSKTEPMTGFAACMGDEEESEEEEEEQPQPMIISHKTYDPYEHAASPYAGSAASGGSPQMTPQPTVKNTFIDVNTNQHQRPSRRTKTAPSRRVAFLGCGGEDSDEDDEEEDNDNTQDERHEEAVQPSLIHQKTYDHFVDTSPPSFAASRQPPQQTQPQQQTSPPMPGAVAGTAVAMAPQWFAQPGQVFTIPIPAGLPIGASHSIQIPTGLPPGSTIVVVPSSMGSVAVQPPSPGSAAAGAAAVPVPVAGVQMPMPSATVAAPAVAGGAAAAAAAMACSGAGSDPGVTAQPQTVSKSSGADGAIRVAYTVDARKLKVNDKAIISPPFEISGANPGQYRVIINPSPVKARGGATFKNSGGMGNVQLKCENPTPGKISFRISVGDGRRRCELARGPVEHDFADGGVCGLPRKVEEWDFNKVVDGPSKTFMVFLDIAQ